jgi:uncharacterized membrane protein YhiD involved in acid resistance
MATGTPAPRDTRSRACYMPEVLARLVEPLPDGGVVALLRLVLAMILGGVVTVIYRLTRAPDEAAPSLPVTLVLLSILIAMVTQVIGDNVARAFSLVGALAIVRFRTVVRDTQDTAYVIFAVAVGMAAGAGHAVLAMSGIGVVAVAAFAMRRAALTWRSQAESYVLTVRVGTGYDAGTLLRPVFDANLLARRVLSIETARQGLALELTYRVALQSEDAAADLVKALNRLDGVQGITLQRRDAGEAQSG